MRRKIVAHQAGAGCDRAQNRGSLRESSSGCKMSTRENEEDRYILYKKRLESMEVKGKKKKKKRENKRTESEYEPLVQLSAQPLKL